MSDHVAFARRCADEIWDKHVPAALAAGACTLTGEAPLLRSSFRVGEAALATTSVAARAATAVGRLRGIETGCSVDLAAAERECTGWFQIDGKTPPTWAPVSGLYPCRDGFVRIHANFDHHREGALQLLGLPPGNETSAEQVADALASWSATAFEDAAAASKLVVSAARTFDEWDAHPHAEFAAAGPLVDIERIGDAEPLALPACTARPLDGIRILDLTRILAGPVCGRTLASYGGDVMLVNGPHLPNIDALADTSRGKRSALLDLRDEGDREQLRRLVSEAHVFIEGYRPGGLATLGFAPEALAEFRPGIVAVSLSAYGSEGPWSDRRGFDSLVQTATGFNHAEAQAFGSDKPKPMPVQILDYASGFLMAFGAQVALARQQTEGGSWRVRVSLARTAHWLRELRQVEPQQSTAPLDAASAVQTFESGFGRLDAMPHAAQFSTFDSGNVLPSVKPGTHPPDWS